ncbi:ATP-binding protein [Pedobacter boryungensis]|uniref:histidine kinase n=1 Tax=Pedobacter boryungensis TaxID=869962 RepID=A0ABX2DD43_9SPHI|nr:ATP-binding protein [Pedobacter boryungensis]NQX31069.1 PAS domain-containing protein [Pedobacter boryungensis]
MIENTFGKNIIPENDTERIAALEQYRIMDSPPEDCFDNLAQLAREFFDVPIALVSLVDAERVYFKSNVGMGSTKESNRGKSLCALAVLDREVTVYEDALKEPCLIANPNVAGDFGLRFYAGAPLISPAGFVIGTLCIIDKVARAFSKKDRQLLAKLAKAVMDQIELRAAALSDRSTHEDEKVTHVAFSEELQAMNEEMSATNEELANSRDHLVQANANLEQILNMLPASVVVIRGYDLVVEMINTSNLTYWKKTKEEVLGKPFLEILPDLADQPFAGQLRRVMDTGEIIDVKESPVLFDAGDGNIRETYVDYTYQPLSDLAGNRNGVLVMSFEITERVISRRLLEKSAKELANANMRLLASNDKLFKSESRFKFLIEEAPVAIGVLHGKELFVETANTKLLEVWGKSSGVVGLPLAEALPEIAGQPFLSILDDVFRTGQAFYANEIRALLEHQGELRELFFNLVYQPVRDSAGAVADILVVAVDVSQQVQSRRLVEQAELTTRLAVEGANVGTWRIDAKTMDIVASPRLKQLFGFAADAEVSVGQLVEQIDPSSRADAVAQMEKVISQGGSYDITYLIGRDGEKKRWLRALGKLTGEPGDDATLFSGVVMDITDIKEDEIRKNDFIAMVSHELKTPLTSLTGYLQYMQRKVSKGDVLSVSMFNQPLRQAKQMAEMINGFLNVSRLDSGKIHIEKSVFDLSELIAEGQAEHFSVYGTDQILFEGTDKLLINGDRAKIGQVLNNLVSNAVKYSPVGASVQITCSRSDGFARVSITDQGIGIRAQDLEKLFERFYRVENNNNISGFGIGLYLCSEIIERHGGRIWAESELGKGSVFTFELPLES